MRQPSAVSGRLVASGAASSRGIQDDATPSDPPLRKCQQDCLEACAKGARKIEMACGTGRTRVMKELVSNISGRVSCLVMENLPEAGRSDLPTFLLVNVYGVLITLKKIQVGFSNVSLAIPRS